jgi:hypothetical protein
MKQQELMKEVEAVIEKRLERGEPAALTWIIEAVMRHHQGIAGADREFFLLCGREHIHVTVRAILRSRHQEEGEPEANQGELFPGYERVQRSYAVPRGGEQVVVRVEHMTDREILDKAMELDAIGLGALAHARELREFLRGRELRHPTTSQSVQ